MEDRSQKYEFIKKNSLIIKLFTIT